MAHFAIEGQESETMRAAVRAIHDAHGAVIAQLQAREGATPEHFVSALAQVLCNEIACLNGDPLANAEEIVRMIPFMLAVAVARLEKAKAAAKPDTKH